MMHKVPYFEPGVPRSALKRNKQPFPRIWKHFLPEHHASPSSSWRSDYTRLMNRQWFIDEEALRDFEPSDEEDMTRYVDSDSDLPALHHSSIPN